VEEKIIVWIFFNVGIGLVPIVFAGFRLYTIKISEIDKLSDAFRIVIARGELLLLTVALCGSSLGGLIATSESLRVLKIVSGGAITIIFLFSSLYFFVVSEIKENRAKSATPHDEKVQDRMITRTSLFLFCSALISCGWSLLLIQV
jgi:hypothetical protein